MTKYSKVALVLFGIIVFSVFLKILDLHIQYIDYFIFHADFKLTTSFRQFFEKIFYVWSTQIGAANIDGVIRFFTRMPLLFFAFFVKSNLLISYFYILFSLGASFTAFFLFSKKFLKIQSDYLVLFFSLIYIFNPVFSGNISKIGLVFAVSSLLFLLICVKIFFETQKYKYAYIGILIILFSLIHPFITIINVLITGLYVLYKLFNKKLNKMVITQILGLFFVSICLFCFAILPIVNIGSIDKNSISSTIGEDAGSLLLINIAKTKGFVEAFSFSKSVLIDYSFYDESYKPYYYVSVYILVFIAVLFLFHSAKYDTNNRKIFLISFLIFLILILFTLGDSYLLSEKINTFFVSLPGGWFFRSPLKWQLYIPIFFTIILEIGYINYYKNVNKAKIQKTLLLSSIAIVFLISSMYISKNIIVKLLIPKKSNIIYELQFDNNQKRSAFLVMNDDCVNRAKSDANSFDELLYFLQQKDINTIKINDKNILQNESFFVSSSYVITCSKNNYLQNVNFGDPVGILNDKFFIYHNNVKNRYIDTTNMMFAFNDMNDLNNKYDFVRNILNKDLKFVVDDNGLFVSIIDKFENANIIEDNSFINYIQNPSFEGGLWQEKVDDCQNYDDNPVLDMRQSDNSSDGGKSLELQATRHIACTNQKDINLSGDGLDSHLRGNDNEVGDDNVGHKIMNSGGTFLLKFDYQSDNAKNAGYYIAFDDEEKTNISEKLPIENNEWNTFEKQIEVPSDATKASLFVYSYPKGGSKEDKDSENIITRYDNFYLTKLPDIQNRYYIVNEPKQKFVNPKETNFEIINPTKKLVSVKGATTPFYLTMSESYHDKWQLQLNNDKVNGFLGKWVPFVNPDVVDDEKHFKYMTFLNGWYVDPIALCGGIEDGGGLDSRLRGNDKMDGSDNVGNDVKAGCTKNDDGSYDIEMVIEFIPQRWFYLGLLISGTTFVCLVGYLGFDFVRRYRRKRGIGKG